MATWAELENEQGEVLVDRTIVPESNKLEGKHQFVVTDFNSGMTKAGNATIIMKAVLTDESKNAVVKDWLDPDDKAPFYWKTQNFVKAIGGDPKQLFKKTEPEKVETPMLMKTAGGYISPVGLTFIANVKTEVTNEGYVNVKIANYYTK